MHIKYFGLRDLRAAYSLSIHVFPPQTMEGSTENHLQIVLLHIVEFVPCS